MNKDRNYYRQCDSRELIDAARQYGDDIALVLADRLEAMMEPRKTPHSDQALELEISAYERAKRLRDEQIADLQAKIMGARHG